MNNPALLSKIATELTARYSSVIRTECESFDSGAEMLRIYYLDRYFVIAFDGHGFWVDEPSEEDGFTSTLRYHVADLSAAADALFHMISSPRSQANVLTHQSAVQSNTLPGPSTSYSV